MCPAFKIALTMPESVKRDGRIPAFLRRKRRSGDSSRTEGFDFLLTADGKQQGAGKEKSDVPFYHVILDPVSPGRLHQLMNMHPCQRAGVPCLR